MEDLSVSPDALSYISLHTCCSEACPHPPPHGFHGVDLACHSCHSLSASRDRQSSSQQASQSFASLAPSIPAEGREAVPTFKAGSRRESPWASCQLQGKRGEARQTKEAITNEHVFRGESASHSPGRTSQGCIYQRVLTDLLVYLRTRAHAGSLSGTSQHNRFR